MGDLGDRQVVGVLGRLLGSWQVVFWAGRNPRDILVAEALEAGINQGEAW